MNKTDIFSSLRRYTLTLLLIAFVFPISASAAETGFVHVSGTRLYLDGGNFNPKGVNLMDHDTLWYSSRILPGAKWLNAKEFSSLKKAGFNSVRVAVKTDYFQDPKPPHTFSAKGFAWLDGVIRQAKSNNIRLILDMHMPTGGYQQDYQINPDNQEFWNDDWMKGRFVDVWREIARRYKDEPTIWAYDLMNEPATVDFKNYERLVNAAAKSIRTYDINHILMLQKGMYIKEDKSWGMRYPEISDENSVFTVHYYQPTDFTLQGASWITNRSNTTVVYPIKKNGDSPAWDSISAKTSLSAPVEASTTRPFILTEFGTLFPQKLSGQLQWIGDVAKAADELGMGWHYWHLSGDTCNNAFALKTRYSICRPMTYGTLSTLAK